MTVHCRPANRELRYFYGKFSADGYAFKEIKLSSYSSRGNHGNVRKIGMFRTKRIIFPEIS